MKLGMKQVVQRQLWKYEHQGERAEMRDKMKKDGWTVDYEKSSYDALYDYFEKVIIMEDYRGGVTN